MWNRIKLSGNNVIDIDDQPTPNSAVASVSLDASPSALTNVLYLTEPGDSSAISITDINQGGIGDCFVLSSIGELACWSPAAVQNMIRYNGNGTYTVTLYVNSDGSLINLNAASPGSSFKPVQVTVGTNFAADSVNSGGQGVVNGQKEIWAQILEEAVAQLYTPAGQSLSVGYAVLNPGGQPSAALAVLTGRAATETLGMNMTAAQLMAYQAIGALVVFGTSQLAAPAVLNLVPSHAYAFEGIVMQGSTAMLKLYNPWGTNEPAPIAISALASYLNTPFYSNGIDYYGGVSVSDPTGVSVAASGLITLANGAAVILNGNFLQLTAGQSDNVTVNGYGNVLNLGQRATVTVASYETGNSFNATLGTFSLNDGNFASFAGNQNTNVGGYGEYWTMSGSNNLVSLNSGHITVSGNYDSVKISAQIAGANAVTLTGTGNMLSASYSSISFATGISGIVQGDWNSITAATGDSPLIEGSHNRLIIGSGSIVYLTGVANTVIASNDSITMYAGASAYFGGSGDTITSWSGGDTFGFMGTFGDMTIADFNPLASVQDVIDIYGDSPLTSFAGVLTHTTQVGTSAVINDGRTSLTLLGVNKANLTAGDFMFSYLGASALAS